MGQVALGLKNLAVRLVIFVIMAALLAWILGGTLFPAPQRVSLPAWDFDGAAWNWRVSGSADKAEPVAWTLLEHREGSDREQRFGIGGAWSEVWGPRLLDGGMSLGIGASPREGAMEWWLLRVRPAPNRRVEKTLLASRQALLGAMGLVDPRSDASDPAPTGASPPAP